uniref:Capsid protein n=1 Tax=Eothenomys eva circovirus TaxID=3040108 RepID=A0AAT9TYC1_9CIRC|nr:capsid protein [Eothenomys eva circovirus]
MAYVRRRRRLRRRRRPSRYWFRRRRRLFIRRPRAGSYYVQRLQHTKPLTINFASSTNFYKTILVTFPLNTFIANTFFDFYRILKAKWSIKPATCITNWTYWGYGLSIIDLDDTTVDTNPQSPPWPNNSTRRQFVPWRKHSRYFTPKAKNTPSGAQSVYFPTRNRQWWWNANDTGTDWLGVKACFYNGRGSNSQYDLIETKTVWVQWRQAI